MNELMNAIHQLKLARFEAPSSVILVVVMFGKVTGSTGRGVGA